MVKIIYCGYWGTYAAFVMAAVHIGIYNGNLLPSPEVIERQRNICAKYGEQYGNLMYMGLDENLNEVYILGCREYLDVIKMGYKGMNTIFGIDDRIWYVDCSSLDGRLCNMITLVNRYNLLNKINKKLFLYWLKHIYKSCVQKVENEKRMIMAGE